MLAMNPWMIAAPAVVAGGVAEVVAYGAVFPRAQLFGPTIFRTRSGKQLALTFDDGPNPPITPQLLDLLAKHNARATFFLVGKFVRECPELTKEIAARGHLIGNHTDTHPNMFFCGPEETQSELVRCQEAIHRATWAAPRWFRPPFGFRSPWLIEIVQRQGMRTAMWTHIPGDWRNKPTEWLIERMKPVATEAQAGLAQAANGAATTGPVLCLHDGDYTHQNGDRQRTVDALAYWLPRWRDLGLEFVTMDETL
jgi:peptidoglycan/xylan/chitin deacetylase (PgdA/CDA1 family)